MGMLLLWGGLLYCLCRLTYLWFFAGLRLQIRASSYIGKKSLAWTTDSAKKSTLAQSTAGLLASWKQISGSHRKNIRRGRCWCPCWQEKGIVQHRVGGEGMWRWTGVVFAMVEPKICWYIKVLEMLWFLYPCIFIRVSVLEASLSLVFIHHFLEAPREATVATFNWLF